MSKKNTFVIGILIVAIACAILYKLLTQKGNSVISWHHDTIGKSFIEEQIKFDVSDKKTLEAIGKLKNLLTYKVKPIGTYVYQDYYYDTADFTLFNLGYSFRFRIRDKGDGAIECGIQFKKEYGAGGSDNFKRVELDDIIPSDYAQKIFSGNWSETFSGLYDLITVKEFVAFLDKNKIDKNLLTPLIYLKQKRNRLRLIEHSVIYFEVSLDEASVNLINYPQKKEFSFLQLEFENKLKGATAKDAYRIKNLIIFFEKNYPVKITWDSKYRSVVTELLEK